MITYKDVLAAEENIRQHAIVTPLLTSDTLNNELGFRLWIKAECLQRTGSFKFRGALNAIATVPDDDLPILAFSSGNHGQGVALAARLANKQATIIMPEDAPDIKISNTKAYGAKTILYDRYNQNREEVVAAYLKEDGDAHLIPPFDDVRVIAGQGTIGLELAKQCAEKGFTPDQAILCCGGGGLISGTSIALKHSLPNIEIFSAEPEHFDDMARSLDCGSIVSNEVGHRSICDAIVTPQPGNITFPICKKLVSKGKVVTDAEVLNAMKLAFQHFKIIVEPGGAVALAAALQPEFQAKGSHVVVIASGGNVDTEMMATALKS